MDTDPSKIFHLSDGRKLGYIEYGDPKGKPLFFFHGWPGSRFSGKEVDTAAKKLGVRVISSDRPGIGLSDFQNHRTLLNWPDDVTELANHLTITRFPLVGVSGGGPYVAVCAYKMPHRIIKAGIVVGLAPVRIKGNLDGVCTQGKIGWANYHRLPFLKTIAALGTAIEFRYFPTLGSLIAFPSKNDRGLFKAMKATTGEKTGSHEAFHQGLRGPQHELTIYTEDWGFALSDIKTKVYLWYGAKDRSVSLNMGRYYHDQISGSELFIDTDGGHLARYRYEEKILRTLID